MLDCVEYFTAMYGLLFHSEMEWASTCMNVYNAGYDLWSCIFDPIDNRIWKSRRELFLTSFESRTESVVLTPATHQTPSNSVQLPIAMT